jgi:hypothetical protein
MVLTPAYLESRGIPYEMLPDGVHFTVPGDLGLYGTQVTSLGNLQTVGGFLDLEDSQVTSLGKLQSVGGFLNLRGTQVTSLGALQTVGGFLDLSRNPIASLGNLQAVEKVLIDKHEKAVSFDEAKKIFQSYRKEISALDPEDLPRLVLQAEYKWHQAVIKENLS